MSNTHHLAPLLVLSCYLALLLSVNALNSLARVRTVAHSAKSSLPAFDPSRAKETLLAIFDGKDLQGNIYACPESLQPLELVTRFYGLDRQSYFLDRKFGAKYSVTCKYSDFTAKANGVDRTRPSLKIGQSFFQNPFVSGIYEMGYRQNFENFGFPGIEKEFQEAFEFFIEGNTTSIVLDVSCGSGFMTRKFSKSKRFDRVIAADLSPTMLQETRRRCKLDDVSPLPELVRCDSAKLPFLTNSISSVHAGAAMHCWPAISQSLSEVYRVLQPRGRFYATTFITGELGGLPGARGQTGFTLFKSDEEIRNLLAEAGFSNERGSCEVRREGSRCVIVKAIKSNRAA